MSVTEFLERFFAGTECDIEIRPIRNGVKPSGQIFSRDHAVLAKAITQSMERRENVFFGCTTRRGKRGSKENAAELVAFWADVDFKEVQEDEALKRIAEFPVPCSLLINSGGGLHAYWFLTEPLDAHDARVQPILKGIAAVLGADAACAEIARVLRVPFTLNYKYTPPREVTIAGGDWERYEIGQFESFAAPAPAAASNAPFGLRIPAGVNLRDALKTKLNLQVRAGKNGETYYDYHGLRGFHGAPQPCAVQGSVHANHNNLAAECSFVEKGGVFCTLASTPIAYAERKTESKTRVAVRRIGLEGVLLAGGIEETMIVRECFADIIAKPVEWDWPERIPRAKLTIFSGDPDLGKSTVACDIVARRTRQREWPDGARNTTEPGDVLMMIAEDDPEDTTKPRLMAAGADMNRVHLLRAVLVTRGAKKTERMLALDTDLALLEAELKANPKIKLVVIDPITNYFGRKDVNRDQELRAVLVPIKEVAERTNVTFIGLGHFNKRSDVSALHRVGGAVAMSGVARAVWMFAKNPEVEGEYLMLLGKGNLTKKRTGLRYRIAEKIVTLPGGKENGVPSIDWQSGEAAANVDDTLAATNDPARRKDAKAKRFLIDFLADGDKTSDEIMAKGKEKGLKRNTLFDAKKVLDIEAYKKGTVWWWSPPKPEPPRREPGEEDPPFLVSTV